MRSTSLTKLVTIPIQRCWTMSKTIALRRFNSSILPRNLIVASDTRSQMLLWTRVSPKTRSLASTLIPSICREALASSLQSLASTLRKWCAPYWLENSEVQISIRYSGLLIIQGFLILRRISSRSLRLSKQVHLSHVPFLRRVRMHSSAVQCRRFYALSPPGTPGRTSGNPKAGVHTQTTS